MVDNQKIIVVGDRVLIRPAKDSEKTNSGLYLPPGVSEKEKVQSGYVLKVGPGFPIAAPSDDSEQWKDESSTKYVKLQANEGDFALFLRKDAVEIELDKQKLMIVPHSAILLLIRDEEILDMQ